MSDDTEKKQREASRSIIKTIFSRWCYDSILFFLSGVLALSGVACIGSVIEIISWVLFSGLSIHDDAVGTHLSIAIRCIIISLVSYILMLLLRRTLFVKVMSVKVIAAAFIVKIWVRVLAIIGQTRSELTGFLRYKMPHFFSRLWLWDGFICDLHNPIAFKMCLVYLSSVPIGVKIRDSLDPLIKDYVCKPENANSSLCIKLEKALVHLNLPFTWTIGFYASVCLVLSFVLTRLSRPIFFQRYNGPTSFISNFEDFREAVVELELDYKGGLVSDKFTHLCTALGRDSIAVFLRDSIRKNDINMHLVINSIEDHFNHKRPLARFFVVIMSITAYLLFSYLAWEQLCWVVAHSWK